MAEVKISIIIPCYNYAHFLAECFGNLQKQSYSNWECLVVDNNSSDDTKHVVEEFTKQEPRIKYLFQPVKGPSAARNLGIKEAKGEYIQFLDADDLLQGNKFKNALQIFNTQADADIVYSGCRYFQDGNMNNLFFSMHGNKINDKDWMPYCQGGKEQMLPHLLKENIMVISSPLIKASTLKQIGLFDESLAFNEDWELWLRFVFADKKFVFDKSVDSLALIRVHKTSHSRNPFKMFLAGLIIGERYMDAVSNKQLKTAFRKKSEYAIYRLERMLYENLADPSFFTDALSQLERAYPHERYKHWKNLFEKKQLSVLRRRMKLHLFISSIKQKL
jgi:glycosyltransferase involved in cell wall biosynthesis